MYIVAEVADAGVKSGNVLPRDNGIRLQPGGEVSVFQQSDRPSDIALHTASQQQSYIVRQSR